MVHAASVPMGQGTVGLFAVERWTIRVAPALGVAAIAASALVMTEPEARWGKVYAGPTDQPGPMAWRVAIQQGSRERPLPLAVNAQLAVDFGGASGLSRGLQTDSNGVAWFTFERPPEALTGPVAVVLSEGARTLAKGKVNVTKQRWLAGQRNDGGLCPGHNEGAIDIKVGVVEGVLLHSTPALLVIAFSMDGRARPNQPFSVQLDGASVEEGTSSSSRVMLVTDERGLSRLTVRATDMAATLTVATKGPNPSRFVGALPVRAGGLRVHRNSDGLAISSPVGHADATVGLLTDSGLVDVRSVHLRSTGDHTSASVMYTQRHAPPLWAMVSLEPELDTGNTIGWPILDETELWQAHSSRVVPNVLVLDGYPLVTQRLDRQRRRALCTSSAALLCVVSLIAWVMLRSNRRHQAVVSQLNRQLEAANLQGVAERTPYALIAVVVMAAATVALAWWTAIGYG